MTWNRPKNKSLQCYHSAFSMPALCALLKGLNTITNIKFKDDVCMSGIVLAFSRHNKAYSDKICDTFSYC